MGSLYKCTPEIIYLTIVSALVLQPAQTKGDVSRCPAGNYVVGQTCVPCSTPPAKKNSMYSLDCEGMCSRGAWGLRCNKQCNSGCFTDFCNRWTGHCIHGCKATYHGMSCDISCPHCEYCDDSEGGVGCVCTKGFYGDVCQNKCPLNCNHNTCTSGGLCKWGCVQGWVGDKCDTQCTHCRYDFATNYYCLNGWYGPFCNHSCIRRCARDVCSKNGSCYDGCRDGVWGKLCDMPCPVNCSKKHCSPSTGQCVDGCITGLYGGRCDRQCPDRCSGVCSREGVCVSCSPGYTGPHCNTSCPSYCLSCHYGRHQCTSCRPGHYGDLCHMRCENCLNGVCDLLTGSCSDGCFDGWYGDLCNISCSDNCKNTSGLRTRQDTCRNLTVSRCSRGSGRCTHGCRNSLYGDSCERRCSQGCRERRCEMDTGRCSGGCTGSVFGEYCNNTCNSRCVNKHCIVVTGTKSVVCTEGCVGGWKGPYCQEHDGVAYELIVLCIILSFVCVGLIWALFRKRKPKCHRYDRGSKWYLSPVTGSSIYSTQTNATLATTVPRDHSHNTTSMLTDGDTGTYQDSMYGYESIALNNNDTDDVASDQQIRNQHRDDTSSCQDDIYMAISDSQFM